MPTIDTSRWSRLCGELENLVAHHNGLSSRWAQLQERRNAVVRQLMQVEAERGRQYGARPAEGVTLASAQAAVLAANQAKTGQRRPIAADHDVNWFLAKGVVDEVDDELGRLEERQSEVGARLGPLRRLRDAVERYCAVNHIPLAGVDASFVARLPGVAPAPAPAGASAPVPSAMGVRR